jgi:uncharacterized protein
LIKDIDIQVSPEKAQDEEYCLAKVRQQLDRNYQVNNGIRLIKRSIDARKRPVVYQLRYRIFVDEVMPPLIPLFDFHVVNNQSERVIIIGSGPAGLFAALECLLHGVKPIVLERGKEVRKRRLDLAKLNKEQIVNPESNYCFGEGGAGTYSDGKLYTRSKKEEVLKRFYSYWWHMVLQLIF